LLNVISENAGTATASAAECTDLPVEDATCRIKP